MNKTLHPTVLYILPKTPYPTINCEYSNNAIERINSNGYYILNSDINSWYIDSIISQWRLDLSTPGLSHVCFKGSNSVNTPYPKLTPFYTLHIHSYSTQCFVIK